MKAITISTLGEKKVVEFSNANSYDTIKNAVAIDGTFDAIDLLDPKGVTMWINDEGKLLGLPQNPIATALWVDSYEETDFTVGDVIITGGADDDGYTTGLTDEQVEYFINYKKQCMVVMVDNSIEFVTATVEGVL